MIPGKIPAFPGAEGGGMWASGGRGGSVYEVTHLLDFSEREKPVPGSLRDFTLQWSIIGESNLHRSPTVTANNLRQPGNANRRTTVIFSKSRLTSANHHFTAVH